MATAAHADVARDRPEGIVFYLDGAGAGGLLLNWDWKIKLGLRDGGFEGEFEDHNWQTGLGPLVDHALSEEDKRDSAQELALEIQQYADRHSGAPVHLIGLSAGTAVLIYTLEALPRSFQVDNVILLNSSLDAGYDLTRALSRVRGKMYVFTSKHDPLLNTLVPMVGTADREFQSRDIAGLRGFVPPPGASADIRRLYAKVVQVPWRPEFARYGNLGSHTGATHSMFVARYIAPLVKQGGPVPQEKKPPVRWPAWPWPRAGR